jgi:hypothetical protein
MMIPFPPWEPDKSAFNSLAASMVLNAKPRVDGWSAMNSLVPFSAALPAEPRGLFTKETASGTKFTFVGTSTKLYKLNPSNSWDDVSTGVYALPAGAYWSFCCFGNRIIAVNGGTKPQYFDVGVSTAFQDLPGSPPRASYVSIVGDMVVLADLLGAKNKLHWSGINNSEQWQPGQNLSDVNEFPDGGAIMAVVPYPGGAYILQRYSIRQMQYAPNSGFTFTFSVINDGVGCISPYSVGIVGTNDFMWYSDTGFKRGPNASPVGMEMVDNWFSQKVEANKIAEILSAIDFYDNIIWFSFLDRSGSTRLIGFDYQLNRWMYSNVAGLSHGLAAAQAVTYEALALRYTLMDDVPLFFDDLSLQAGRFFFAGFDASFRLCFATGPNLAAEIQTNAMHLIPENRAYVKALQIVGAIVDPLYSVTVESSAFYGTSLESIKNGCAPSLRTRIVPIAKSGRVHKFTLKMSAGQIWDTITGALVDFVPEGRQ